MENKKNELNEEALEKVSGGVIQIANTDNNSDDTLLKPIQILNDLQ